MLDWFTFKDVMPRSASAGILLHADGSGDVLLARRNDALQFMGGHHVFPGGAVDKEDDGPAWVDNEADPAMATAIFAAAREIFEETGILCVERLPVDLEALHNARSALLKGDREFASVLHEFQARIPGERFIFAGKWITPPFSPIRFQTNYFLYHYDGPRYERVEPESGGEIVGLEWITPRDARKRWQAGALRLSTPVAFVLQHLAALNMPEVLPWLRNTPGLDFEKPNRFELRRGMGLVPVRSVVIPPATHTNCVIWGEEALWVIDPGANDPIEQAYLLAHIEHLVALGGQVQAILLTHGHPDHTGAVEAIRARYGAPVYAHPATSGQDHFVIDRPLHEGDVIEIVGDPGWRMRVLHTPGHDPGHLCFIEETTRTLIAGDMASNPGTILVAPSYGGNMQHYLDSLERLLGEEFSFLLPAHGLPLWGKAAKEKLRELLAHRLAREAKIIAALDSGADTLDALVALAYADTPGADPRLAAEQARAHLDRLGRVLPA
jgi:ribonuclease/clavin/mitogillin